MLLNSLTNVMFFATIASGAGMLLFEHQAFIVFYIGLGTLLVLSELKHITVQTVLFFFIITLALLILAIRAIIGSIIPLSFIPNLVIGASLAHTVIRGEINPKTAYLFFYMVIGYFIYHMLNGAHPNELFKSSQNAVSSYAISSLMLIIFIFRQHRIAVPLFPAMLCLVVCIWAIGRSGIIVSSVIFTAILFAKDFRLKVAQTARKKISVKILITTLSALTVFFMWEKLFIGETSYLYYFMAKGFADYDRAEIILDYLNNMTTFGLVFGLDLDKLAIISYQSSNPHNSYITLHAVIGFVGIIMLSFVACHVISEFVSGNVSYGIVVVAYLFRIATDSEIGMNVFTCIFLTLTFKGISGFIPKKYLNLYTGIIPYKLNQK